MIFCGFINPDNIPGPNETEIIDKMVNEYNSLTENKKYSTVDIIKTFLGYEIEPKIDKYICDKYKDDIENARLLDKNKIFNSTYSPKELDTILSSNIIDDNNSNILSNSDFIIPENYLNYDDKNDECECQELIFDNNIDDFFNKSNNIIDINTIPENIIKDLCVGLEEISIDNEIYGESAHNIAKTYINNTYGCNDKQICEDLGKKLIEYSTKSKFCS